MVKGAKIVVGADLDNGTLHIWTNTSKADTIVFEDCVRPSMKVGGGLYPIVAGMKGAKIRLHCGGNDELLSKHASFDRFQTFATAKVIQKHIKTN